jgi:hypothetical protein
MASAVDVEMEMQNHGFLGTGMDGALWSDFLP